MKSKRYPYKRIIHISAAALYISFASCNGHDDTPLPNLTPHPLQFTGEIMAPVAVQTRVDGGGTFGEGTVTVQCFADGATENPQTAEYTLKADGTMELKPGETAPVYRDKSKLVTLRAYGTVKEVIVGRDYYLPIEAEAKFIKSTDNKVNLEFLLCTARVSIVFKTPLSGSTLITSPLRFTDPIGLTDAWTATDRLDTPLALKEDNYAPLSETVDGTIGGICLLSVLPGKTIAAGVPLFTLTWTDTHAVAQERNLVLRKPFTVEAGYIYTFNYTPDGIGGYVADDPVIAPMLPGNGEGGEDIWGADGK